MKSKKIKICNAYAGIGGNRKFWTNCEVTAIEINPDIAKIYQDFFPDDNVIVGDAHEYLLNHLPEFDFIWSSPPCPSHGWLRLNSCVKKGQSKAIYPDMKLWQEIIFLESHFNGHYVVENVIPYYVPYPGFQKLGRHLFWSNFHIYKIKINEEDKAKINISDIRSNDIHYGFNIKDFSIPGQEKSQVLSNCVNPELGLHIFNCIPSIKDENNFKQNELFNEIS